MCFSGYFWLGGYKTSFILHSIEPEISTANILSVNEKLPVSKFRYFGKYIIQLFGYSYVHVSGQRQVGLER